MREKSEILQELEFLQKEKDDVQQWFERANKRYKEDVNTWGKAEADHGEVLAAGDALNVVSAKIEMLNWILKK